jgi:GT2 family glycosyltransferase
VTPSVSVVIPTYKRPDLLQRCLEAVLAQDFGEPYEVIVVDDAGASEARGTVEGFRDCRLKYIPNDDNHGPAAARNLGWHTARSCIIAFTDDDTIPEPGWLREGVAVLEEGFAGVSGRVRVPTHHPPTDYEATTAGLEASVFVTANAFYRRCALEAVGGFDERFTTAWREDADLEFKLRAAGQPLGFAPDSVVIHPVRKAPWGVSIREQRKSMFNALLYKKHPRRYRHRVGLPPLRYYAIAASLLLAIGSFAAGHRRGSALFASLWGLQTLLFAAKRLNGTSHTPSHVMEMLTTSAVIPLLSIFWRLRGAVRFRVFFF